MAQIEDQNSEIHSYRNQLLTTFTVSLTPLTFGIANGWASPYLAQLKSNSSDNYFQLNDYETSWVGSLIFLALGVGAFVGAVIQVFIGRKKTLLCSSCLSVLGWVSIILATSVTWLYASRICNGLSAGFMWSSSVLFLSEIASPKIRGSVILFSVNMVQLGAFVGNLIGPYISMHQFAYLALIPNILFLLIFSVIPDSPYQFLIRNNLLKAEKSLRWFLRKSDVKKELREIEEYIKNSKLTVFERLSDFKNPDHLKNVAVILGLSFCTFFSGLFAVNTYTEIIVRDIEISIDSSVAVIILSFCTIIAGFVSTFLVDIIGRRLLYSFSCIIAAVALFLIGLCYYFISIDFRPVNITWFAFFSLSLFLMSYGNGPISVPTTLASEMFPPSMKIFTTTMYTFSLALWAFLSTLTFTQFNNLVGTSVAYWIRGLVITITVPLCYLAIKETKGKSLLEIQQSVTSVTIMLE